MATINTATVTLNAAFLQEIKEVNQELWQLLEGLRSICLDRVALKHATSRLRQEMPKLRDQLAMYFALEEAYGYFENPLEAAPRLADQAAALKDEHAGLFVAACQLAEVAESLGDSQRHGWMLQRMAEMFQDFDAQLSKHESAENCADFGRLR